jgi:hypothetical protein
MQARPISLGHAFVARLLVAVLLVVSAAPLLHAGDDHDGEHAAALALHDCTQHDREIAAPGETTFPDVHCAACHFGRHLRSISGFGQGVFGLFAPGARLIPEPDRVPRIATALPLPARAPPTSLPG